jgi:hypothetical protein
MNRKNKNRGYQQLRVWQDAITLYVETCRVLAIPIPASFSTPPLHPSTTPVSALVHYSITPSLHHSTAGTPIHSSPPRPRVYCRQSSEHSDGAPQGCIDNQDAVRGGELASPGVKDQEELHLGLAPVAWATAIDFCGL